ncbi:MAG: signal peptidase I, partial [Armatimonadota bacterium]|nr:signal peptidase I [Armatimonadota bacterium]
PRRGAGGEVLREPMPITINTKAPKRPAEKAGKKSPSKLLLRLFEGVVLVLAVLCGLMIRFGIYETAIVTSTSMQPTLQIAGRLLIDHRNSLHGRWQRGDILLFYTPASWEGGPEMLVKRLIGLPGETVEIRQGTVFINDRPLVEKYLGDVEPEMRTPVVLRTGEYFVLGDNRAISNDSRQNGPIHESDISGRAVWRLAPMNSFGKLPAVSY